MVRLAPLASPKTSVKKVGETGGMINIEHVGIQGSLCDTNPNRAQYITGLIILHIYIYTLPHIHEDYQPKQCTITRDIPQKNDHTF